MNNLKDVVKELALNMKRASVDLEAAPWQSRPSLTNMKREAEEKVKQLKDDYFRQVRSSTFGIFVFGELERVKAFMQIAAEEAGVMEVDGGLLYRRLTDSIEPTLGTSREFGPAQYQRLLLGLQDIKEDLEIRSMRFPEMSNLIASKDRAGLERYIRGLVNEAVGDDLVRVYVDRQINRQAVASEFSGNLLPVAVTGLDHNEVAALTSLFTNSVSVEVGTSEDGEVTKEYVLTQLESVKKKLKSRAKPN